MSPTLSMTPSDADIAKLVERVLKDPRDAVQLVRQAFEGYRLGVAPVQWKDEPEEEEEPETPMTRALLVSDAAEVARLLQAGAVFPGDFAQCLLVGRGAYYTFDDPVEAPRRAAAILEVLRTAAVRGVPIPLPSARSLWWIEELREVVSKPLPGMRPPNHRHPYLEIPYVQACIGWGSSDEQQLEDRAWRAELERCLRATGGSVQTARV